MLASTERISDDALAVIRRRRIELGAFLRQRRTRLRPADLGLIVTGRRHVRGLRRDEVAEAAGIGLSWYTMLEQGRVENVSTQTLGAVAEALRLGARERAYLRSLAVQSFEELDVDRGEPSAALVEFVRTFPLGGAFLHSSRCDLVAWNPFAERFFGFSGDGPAPNILRQMLREPELRQRFVNPDWNTILERMLGTFRGWFGEVGGTDYDALVDELRAYPEFEKLWDERPIYAPPSERGSIVHPERGPLEVNVIAFFSPSSPTYAMVLMIESDRAADARPNLPGPQHGPAPAERGVATMRRRRIELGTFIRHRRERMHPAQAGLEPIGRRRAKGLRRDEIAQLAGIGVSWYTMLEQGRVENVSSRTLNAVAAALRLTSRERAYLRGLGAGSFSELAALAAPPTEDLLAFVRTYPLGHAHFTDERFDLHAWNALADEFYEFSRHTRPNMLEVMALERDVRSRHLDPDWRGVLRRMIGHFRYVSARCGDGRAIALIDRLCAASPEFADVWSSDPTVADPPAETIVAHYGERGVLRLTVLVLVPFANPHFTLVLKTPFA